MVSEAAKAVVSDFPLTVLIALFSSVSVLLAKQIDGFRTDLKADMAKDNAQLNEKIKGVQDSMAKDNAQLTEKIKGVHDSMAKDNAQLNEKVEGLTEDVQMMNATMDSLVVRPLPPSARCALSHSSFVRRRLWRACRLGCAV